MGKICRSYQRIAASIIIVCFACILISPVEAAEKTWVGSGDAATWADDDNWYESGAPSLSDDVVIDVEDATVNCSQTFYANSITLGGREGATLISNNYIYGTVQPGSTSDEAVHIRSGGTLILTGSGTLTVKGQYKDSEELSADEPSFMFWLE